MLMLFYEASSPPTCLREWGACPLYSQSPQTVQYPISPSTPGSGDMKCLAGLFPARIPCQHLSLSFRNPLLGKWARGGRKWLTYHTLVLPSRAHLGFRYSKGKTLRPPPPQTIFSAMKFKISVIACSSVSAVTTVS